MARDNFPLKKGIFWTMGQKYGNFLMVGEPFLIRSDYQLIDWSIKKK